MKDCNGEFGDPGLSVVRRDMPCGCTAHCITLPGISVCTLHLPATVVCLDIMFGPQV